MYINSYYVPSTFLNSKVKIVSNTDKQNSLIEFIFYNEHGGKVTIINIVINSKEK